jgi:NAD(P)H-hydrate epimerase
MEIERIESIPALPPRPADSHKGMFGSVLVLAGSRGMAGAAALTGAAALRSGAGLVRVASPAEISATVAQFEPSYMTYPLPCDHAGIIDFPAAGPAIEDLMGKATVLAAGPGLGQGGHLPMLVRWLLEMPTVPTVLDADALNALVGQTELLRALRRPVVITPHPGEAARLLGKTTADVQADRERAAFELARHANLIVVLKGQGTIVTDGLRIFVNTTGNPGMAKGGSGDVLTGVISALLAQGLEPFEAAQLGVYAHGVAGNIARDQNGVVGMVAGDIVDSLADAFDLLGAGAEADG